MSIKKGTLFSLCVVSALFTCCVSGLEQPSPIINVNWQFAELANCHDSKADSQSYCDVIEYRLFKEMPQHRFNRNPTNVPRMESMMRERIDFCTMDLFHSKERERHMVFSEPVHWVFSNVLLARKGNRLMASTKKTAISLSAFNNVENVTVGVRKGRRYSDQIEQLLEREQIQKNLYVAKDERTLVSMLSAGRIDYMFVNPPEIAALNDNDNILSYPIADSPLAPVYVSCTRTKKGMRTIYAINQAIAHVPQSELNGPYLDVLPNELHYAFKVKLETIVDQ
jgi:uncharacterized protein (TIGR02285 family)